MTDATPTPADARAIKRIREFYSQPTGEFAQSLKLANHVLDDASRDTDSDISVLARQLLRRVENIETLLTAEIAEGATGAGNARVGGDGHQLICDVLYHMDNELMFVAHKMPSDDQATFHDLHTRVRQWLINYRDPGDTPHATPVGAIAEGRE